LLKPSVEVVMPLVSEFMPLVGRIVHSANLLLEWLLTYAIHSTVLIGGLLCLTLIPVGRRLVTAHSSWLWRFALVGGVVTALMQSLRTESPLGGTVRLDGDRQSQTMVRMEVERDRAVVANGSWRTARDRNAVVNASITITPAWPLIALGVWLVIATSLVARFFIARARFLRAIGPRESADHTLAGNSLRYLLREGGITRPVRLTLSERLTSPVALGDDEICLPARALAELDPVRMESILAHELAHLVRRDPSWLTISRVIEGIFFFQPLNIVARRRMQESAEFASDAWASSRVARPLDLAHCLARVAEWTIAAPRLPVPAMAEGQGPGRRGPVLVRRVERLTTGRVIHEVAPGRALRLSAALALVGLTFLAPRAAIGAEGRAGRFFNTALGPRVGAFIGIRDVDSVTKTTPGARKNTRMIMVRVDSRH
jgi:Zn-dependent protease with chaperone function